MKIFKTSFQYSTYTAKETPFHSEIMRYNDLEQTNTLFLRENRKDVYKTWTGVHGPPHGPGPWTTTWTWSMGQLHGPPLIFKGKSPLLIWKFTRGQGMKNTDSYLLLMPLRVCLVKGGYFWIATPYKWEDHKLVLRYRRPSAFLPPIFSFQHFQIAIRSGRHHLSLLIKLYHA